MPFNYKNPITPEQLKGAQSVSRSSTQGTNFSILGIGGYVEVYNLTDLIYTIPSGTTGPIQFSGNSLPITFTKGTGSSFSPDVLTLNSDNISSGRRRLGMLAYVKELDQVYQFDISNFETLWNAATGATGIGGNTVVFSDFGTTVRNNSVAGQNFINAWTGTSIEGYLGVTRSTSNWKKFWSNNLAITGGTYNGSNNTVTLINITGGSQSFIINTMSGLTINGNLSVTGTTTFGNGTFTKTGFNTGDVLLDNNGTDTPGVLFYYANNSNYGIDSWNGSYDILSGQLLRFTNKLNESGGAVKMAVDTSGNLAVGGFVKVNAWQAGQIIQMKLYNASDLSFNSNYTNNTGTYTSVVSGTYTPLSSSSYIFFEVYAMYFVDGAAADSFFSQITWNGAEIGVQRQVWANGSGGGTRSGTLFPLAGRVTNSSLTGYAWGVNVRRDSSDDTITVYNNAEFYVKITEIAR